MPTKAARINISTLNRQLRLRKTLKLSVKSIYDEIKSKHGSAKVKLTLDQVVEHLFKDIIKNKNKKRGYISKSILNINMGEQKPVELNLEDYNFIYEILKIPRKLDCEPESESNYRRSTGKLNSIEL
jgi:hypothetical protein